MPIGISIDLPAMGIGAVSAIESAVETLARVNMEYLSRYPNTVLLSKSGVRYRRETPGKRERWQSIPEMLRSRFGDCEDLSAWRIAELRKRGYTAYPFVKGKRGHYHIQAAVRLSGKQYIFDPSRELGM